MELFFWIKQILFFQIIIKVIIRMHIQHVSYVTIILGIGMINIV
jgi:hypothetical protein